MLQLFSSVGLWFNLVMKTGHPRANFGPPAPAPTNTRTHIYGCGIPVDTGVPATPVGFQTDHGSLLWVSIYYMG